VDEDQKLQHKKALEALAKYQAKGAVPEAVELVLATETDRALVTILGSFIEDALLERIISELPHGGQTRRTLLKGGPLRSPEHRIALAQAMGIVSEFGAARLNVFRAMRNACAHSRLNITFETPELRNALAALLPKKIGDTVIAGTNEGSLRGLFLASASLALSVLQGITEEEARALADAATDGTGNVHADKVLLATLRGKPKNKSAPDPRRDRKDKER
jgi:hypothetical protein